jgi:hypothetical protein
MTRRPFISRAALFVVLLAPALALAEPSASGEVKGSSKCPHCDCVKGHSTSIQVETPYQSNIDLHPEDYR